MSPKKRTNEEWRELLAEQRSSGQTQEQWCATNGINLYTLRDRGSRLRRLDREANLGPAGTPPSPPDRPPSSEPTRQWALITAPEEDLSPRPAAGTAKDTSAPSGISPAKNKRMLPAATGLAEGNSGLPVSGSIHLTYGGWTVRAEPGLFSPEQLAAVLRAVRVSCC